jgi:ketopantoate hydroxymethyltransferase
MAGAASIAGAVEGFVKEVKAGTYPGAEHSL